MSKERKRRNRFNGLYEFSDTIKLEALKHAEFKCQRCSKPKEEVGILFFHHILPVAIAAAKYPNIAPHLIGSLANCRVLCHDCHLIEDRESRLYYRTIAQALLFMDKLQPALL